jgi:hypothetical protein
MKKTGLVLVLIAAAVLPSLGQTVDWSAKKVQSERERPTTPSTT